MSYQKSSELEGVEVKMEQEFFCAMRKKIEKFRPELVVERGAVLK